MKKEILLNVLLRDIYDNDTKNIYIEGNEAYQKAKKFERAYA